MKFYIKSDKIFLENEIFKGYIEVEDGVITDICDYVSDSENIKDYSDNIVAAGYFDTHIHGYGGYDVMDCTDVSLSKISENLISTGVTSFLATTLTDSVEKLNSICQNIFNNKYKCKKSKLQGIFLEGPFFSEKFKGAQNEKYMINPNIDILKKWQDLSGDMIKKIAIAPEKKESAEFIKEAKKMGIIVALGHSNATYEQAKRAVDVGANIFVHTYNAMTSLHHRNPGMVGAALSTENTYSELICDGHHVHPAAIKVVMRAKTKKNTLLITDCMMAGGLLAGNYKLGEFDVIVENGTVRLKSGSLAGSILSMDRAVRNIVNWNLASPLEAVNMASIVPAKSVNMDDKIGSIAVGKYADFNILSNDLYIKEVYVDGISQFVAK